MDTYSVEYIREEIDERINDILEEFQSERGIEYGDIPFGLGAEWEDVQSKLADIVRKVMDWQEANAPRVKYEQTYAPDTDTTFIMKDTYMFGDLAKREVTGFYSGEPSEGRLRKFKNAGTVAEY